jgi:hypothetical protein
MQRFLNKGVDADRKRRPDNDAEVTLASGSSPAEETPAPLVVGQTPEETKRLRSDRAATIRAMTAADFAAQKDELVKELASLRGVEPGWCHEEAE